MIPFTGVGIYSGFRGQEWLKYRIEIFKEFTLKSLLNQTTKDWILWLSFRQEEKKNPLVKDFWHFLVDQNIKFVITCNGLIYHDDKYSKGTLNKILNFGRIIRSCWREKNFSNLKSATREILYDKNKALPQRLASSLAYFKGWVNDYKWIYLTRLDSDDMFHKDALKEIQSQPAWDKVAYLLKKGYVYNKNTQELAEWNPDNNPPFYTIVFPKETFLDPQKHLKYMEGFQSHEDIPKIFDSKWLRNGLYCVLVHSQQISTIFNHPFRGEVIRQANMKAEILRDFGI